MSLEQLSGMDQVLNYSASDENPVFKIAVKSLNNRFEQKYNDTRKPNKDRFPFKLGDFVEGSDLNDIFYQGYVIALDNNKNTLTIKDEETSKTIKLDFQSCRIINKNKDDIDSRLNFVTENYIKTFDEFISS